MECQKPFEIMETLISGTLLEVIGHTWPFFAQVGDYLS